MTALLSYGTDMPERSMSRQFDGNVVVQAYHELVIGRRYAEVFPDARRFVYVNFTTIDPWRLSRRRVAPPLRDDPDPWRLPRLDLSRPRGRSVAIEEASASIDSGPTEIHGVFLDDLDRIEDTGLILDLVHRLHASIGWMPQLFVNRGFSHVSGLGPLAALLIEDVRSAASSGADPDGVIRWIQQVVLPAVTTARTGGACVYQLEYAGVAAADPRADDALRGELDGFALASSRSLHPWTMTHQERRNP